MRTVATLLGKTVAAKGIVTPAGNRFLIHEYPGNGTPIVSVETMDCLHREKVCDPVQTDDVNRSPRVIIKEPCVNVRFSVEVEHIARSGQVFSEPWNTTL